MDFQVIFWGWSVCGGNFFIKRFTHAPFKKLSYNINLQITINFEYHFCAK